MKKSILFGAAFAALFSCSSQDSVVSDSQDFFRHDMEIEINGKKGIGFLVVPQAEKYEIKITSKSDIDLLTVRNCHRSLEFEKAWKDNGAFKGKDHAKFELLADNPIEKEYCMLDLGAWNIKGRHSFGVVDFQNNKFQLPAILSCNGENKAQSGVSICQAYAGSYQEIRFPNESVMRPTSKECDLALDDNSVFRYEIKKGLCVYLIKDMVTKKMHRLTTIGYHKIILKE